MHNSWSEFPLGRIGDMSTRPRSVCTVYTYIHCRRRPVGHSLARINTKANSKDGIRAFFPAILKRGIEEAGVPLKFLGGFYYYSSRSGWFQTGDILSMSPRTGPTRHDESDDDTGNNNSNRSYKANDLNSDRQAHTSIVKLHVPSSNTNDASNHQNQNMNASWLVCSVAVNAPP